MSDYNFSGVDNLDSTPDKPSNNPGGYDFSGIDDIDEQASPVGIAKTAVEGLASGATLGASKVLESKLLDNAKEQKLREQVNPVTSTLSNIAGFGGMAALTGGLGAIGEALGGGALANVAGGALEGAAIGGVNQATDDWSQDKPLDANKIAASAGLGALLGGGGTGIIEGLSKGAGAIGEGLSKFNGFSKDIDVAPEDTNFAQKVTQAYQLAGDEGAKSNLTNQMVDAYSDLYDTAKQAKNDMYQKAGQANLSSALKDMSLDDAKALGDSTLNKIDSILNPADETGGTASILDSSTNARVVDEKISSLENDLNSAQTPLDVHNALSSFATDFDKTLKFDKIPTASQQVDQDILRSVRQTIRGDLKNPDLWGKAAPVYQELSDNYANYSNAQKNFSKSFMTNRIGSNGNTTKVVDPSKVKSFLSDMEDPTRALKAQSLQEFTDSAHKMATYAQNYEGFQQGMDDLAAKIDGISNDTLNASNKMKVLKAIKDAKEGHRFGLLSLGVVDALPSQLKVIFGLLRRYGGETGGYQAGADLYSVINGARNLSKHVEAVTNKIDRGAKLIFSGASSQSRKLN